MGFRLTLYFFARLVLFSSRRRDLLSVLSVHRCRRAVVQGLMHPLVTVKAEVAGERFLGLPAIRRYTSSYFTLRQSRSTNTLSNARPRPSMLIDTPACCKRPVNEAAVNCDP